MFPVQETSELARDVTASPMIPLWCGSSLQWEDQHTGLSCEEFAEWKRLNDPKFKKEGLAAYLQANGTGMYIDQ